MPHKVLRPLALVLLPSVLGLSSTLSARPKPELVREFVEPAALAAAPPPCAAPKGRHADYPIRDLAHLRGLRYEEELRLFARSYGDDGFFSRVVWLHAAALDESTSSTRKDTRLGTGSLK